MRYIDTGSRDPLQALGTWLNTNLLYDSSIIELRLQTGFFGADSLAYFAPVMMRLIDSDGVLSVLLGSNDGTTQASDVEALLEVAGPPRANRRIGIISFDTGYFHPKTVHFRRTDGSAAAYVGSANLTGSGVASLHVEAGIILETREGDDEAVLDQVSDAIDWWFDGPVPRSGFNIISNRSELKKFVKSGILNVRRPKPPHRPKVRGGNRLSRGVKLKRLLEIPKLVKKTTGLSHGASSAPQGGGASAAASASPVVAAQWVKQLSRSDAQRKAAGNQRGSITLVQAGQPINAQTYFRNELFGSVEWIPETTRTNETRESATIPFHITVLGNDLGTSNLTITYAANREASQANYTSLLHLSGPLGTRFLQQVMTGEWLALSRATDGSYALSILHVRP